MNTRKFTPEKYAMFERVNRRKIEDAVAAVKRNYERTRDVISDKLSKDGYESVKGDLAVLGDFKTLIDAYEQLHAHVHHFRKYHAADIDACGGGEYYLGTECVRCEFSRSQQRAIDDNARITER